MNYRIETFSNVKCKIFKTRGGEQNEVRRFVNDFRVAPLLVFVSTVTVIQHNTIIFDIK